MEYLQINAPALGVIVNICLLFANLGVLLAIICQFRKQGQQLAAQKREFSLQSFQDSFFQLLNRIHLDTEKFQITDLYKNIIDKIRTDESFTYVQMEQMIRIRKDLDIEERRPMVNKVLELISENIGPDALQQKDAYFYTKLLASDLRAVEVKEYLLLSVREALENNNMHFYTIAEKLGFFKNLERITGTQEIDNLNEKLFSYIQEILKN